MGLIENYRKNRGGGGAELGGLMGGGREHLEMRWIEKTRPTPSTWHETERLTPK